MLEVSEWQIVLLFGLRMHVSNIAAYVLRRSSQYRATGIRSEGRNYMPPNKAMHRKLDPGIRLATPSLSPASSSGDLRR